MNLILSVRNRSNLRALLLASALLITLAACAGTPVPLTQMAVAEAAVQQARSDSTSENAPTELQIAITRLASAQAALENEDFELAGQLAEQAEVDAQVAQMRAQAVRSELAAAESQAAASALRQELNR